MRRYWLQAQDKEGDLIHIHGESFHHIFDVCRHKVGDKFEVLLGDSKAYFVELVEVSKRQAKANIKEVREIPALKKPHIHLVQCLSKYPTMDHIVEKSVELGVHSLHPVVSDFSFVKQASRVSENKINRWHKIAQGATQQSGRGDLMKIEAIEGLEKCIEETHRNPSSLCLFCYEGVSTLSIKEALEPAHSTELDEIWVIVGSEGGFSDREVERFQGLGHMPVTLGDQVLRVETACLALISIIKYDLGLMA